MTNEFNLTDGWRVRGVRYGDVVIEHLAADQTVDVQLTLTDDTWASVVSSVSAMGKTDETYYAARAFHNGRVDVAQMVESVVRWCKVRAKFMVDSLNPYNGIAEVNLRPVMNGSEENKMFWQATPVGDIRMSITNPDTAALFEKGREFYVDFIGVNLE